MLCVADYLDALTWVRGLGGLTAAIAKSKANLSVVEAFVSENDWIHFLAKEPETLSNTSICLTVDATPEQVKAMIKLLDDAGVAYDIGAYRDAPSGLRIWGGATVEQSDLEALMPWLNWAYQSVVGTA